MSRRGAAIALVLVLLAALGGFAGGFVYGHQPVADDVEVQVAETRPAPTEVFIAGTIDAINGQRVSVRTETETLTFAGAIAVPVDELLAASVEQIEVGAPVNVGGNIAGEGPVLTGVVTLGRGEATH
ncbi:MAG TPA: hypothetical protein QGI71_03990 [Dehalococcoidia bacterium]|nr:hypothetical protein [Dehalococcoidia bacterium]